MNRKCGLLADERYLGHETGQHVETPQRLRAIYDMLDREGLRDEMIKVEPRMATVEEVGLNHDRQYIDMLGRFGAGSLNADTVLSEKSYDTALLAVGGCLDMVDAIMAGEISTGFALVRPPGHHAERERGMGFCLFNNIAVAARHLMKKHGVKRTAILDWDLHHGNGTQHSFYTDKEALYLSIHQSPCYPGTGMMHETGEGDGEGHTVNLPVPAGVGDEGYIKSFRKLFMPIISEYKPEIILVSSGFDSHFDDPLGGMNVTAGGFAKMGEMLIKAADKSCDGRIAFFLEGGYSLQGLADSVEAVIKEALGQGANDEASFTRGISIDSAIEKAKEIHA